MQVRRMTRVAPFFAAGTFALLLGCSSDGIVFNGQAQVQQYPIRTTPVVHYNLPSEIIDPITGDASLDFTFFQNLTSASFTELASPGHDLWAHTLDSYHCSDNPSPCRNPMTEVPDWPYMFDGGYQAAGLSGVTWPPGGSWPHPQMATGGGGSGPIIAAWTLAMMNQWYLRDVDGAALASPLPNTPPVTIESVGFASMAISIHEHAAAGSGYSPQLSNSPPSAVQQETGNPATQGANGKARVMPPINNAVCWGYNGVSAPAGLLGMAWREAPAQNIHIETNTQTAGGGSPAGNTVVVMQNVPVPDYFGGGGPVNGGGGVFSVRYIDQWWQTTDGNSNVAKDDGLTFCYYFATIGCHLMGYGVGLVDSSFASGGVQNGQEDIMSLSVILDMTGFIAAEREFQIVTEDLQRMQDVVNGDWMTPGQLSTLPGSDR